MQRIQWLWIVIRIWRWLKRFWLKLSTFPQACKIAIFKKGARTDPKNYRPILLLPRVSKIIERSIHFQIEDYLNEKKLIYMYQSGFRTNHSINFSLAQLIDRLCLAAMDKQMHTAMIFVGLKKAFDTLSHAVLLEKMKCFGFRTSVIKWFESYLSNRKFLVCINVFSWGCNIKIWCTTRLYSWTAPFSIICKRYYPITIRSWLLFLYRWHLYFLPRWGR